MQTKLLKLSIFILVFPILSAQAGTLAISDWVDGNTRIRLLSVYQTADDILYTAVREKVPNFWMTMPVSYYHTLKVEVDFPVLLAKKFPGYQCGDSDEDKLFLNGLERFGAHLAATELYNATEKVSEYDPSKGDGWVVTEALGLVYARHYPWVWREGQGWIMVVEDIIVPTGIENGKRSGLGRNSFWFWSEQTGWFWKYNRNKWAWFLDTGEWVAFDLGLGE